MKQQKNREKKETTQDTPRFSWSLPIAQMNSVLRSLISIEAAKAELHPSAPGPHFMYMTSSRWSQWEVWLCVTCKLVGRQHCPEKPVLFIARGLNVFCHFANNHVFVALVYIVNRNCFRFIIIQSLAREICSKTMVGKSFPVPFPKNGISKNHLWLVAAAFIEKGERKHN